MKMTKILFAFLFLQMILLQNLMAKQEFPCNSQNSCEFTSSPLPLRKASPLELISTGRWSSSNEGEILSGHSWITEQGHELAFSETQFFNLNIFSSKKDFITSSVNLPDKVENNMFTFSGHFYDPDTGMNWLGSSSNTGLRNFLRHSKQSIEDYKASKFDSAFRELSFALHYLQDSCVPHHASNLIAYTSWHLDFERYSQVSQSSYHFTKSLHPLPKNLVSIKNQEKFEIQLADMLVSCARHGKSLIGKIENTVDASKANTYVESRCYTGSNSLGAPDCDEWDKVIEAVLNQTVSRSAQFLSLMAYRFQSINKNPVINPNEENENNDMDDILYNSLF